MCLLGGGLKMIQSLVITHSSTVVTLKNKLNILRYPGFSGTLQIYFTLKFTLWKGYLYQNNHFKINRGTRKSFIHSIQVGEDQVEMIKKLHCQWQSMSKIPRSFIDQLIRSFTIALTCVSNFSHIKKCPMKRYFCFYSDLLFLV